MFTEICYWLIVAFIFYTYLGYPFLLALAGRRRRGVARPDKWQLPSVSLVLAVYNEERLIGTRLEGLTTLINATGLDAEIIVVSDGSTDDTTAIVRPFTKDLVRLLALPSNVGKAAALTQGWQAADKEILVFADARQTWAPDALRHLLTPFADAEVGAVSGDLVIESRPGVMGGVGLYWKYEKWIRRHESHIHSTIGVTGAICALRRHLFRPIPAGTLLDDVFWPLQVNLQGYRVIHESRARAFDRLPERVGDEFRRKVRTLTGNFQLLTLLPSALLPWRNPVWFQFLSHKVFRLLVPWGLLVLLGLNFCLTGPLYLAILWAQILFYGMALVGFNRGVGKNFRPAAAASSFLVLNAAAWCASWNWLFGRASRSWGKVLYTPPPDVSSGAAREPLVA
jgi:cellulose synthase/poly-beta-1,6-N-acetylglucosamine synthase-like glycosyltransferase